MSRFQCPHCHGETSIFQGGPQHGPERLLAGATAVPLLADIPIDPQLASSSDKGQPVVIAAPQSATSAQYSGLAQKVLQHLGMSGGPR